MTLSVRVASLEKDHREMIEILDRNIPGADQEAHFRWRHQCNPAGPGWSWILRNGSRDSIVAMASVFPRKMYVAGKATLCGRVGEFVIDASHRSLGPAVLLQRATFGPVDSGRLALCYDCPPHDRGMSTFVRLGMRPNCEVHRYAFALRSDEILARRLGSGLWTKPVVAGANLLLKMRTGSRRPLGLEISHFDKIFDEEFSRLDSSLSSSTSIRASRSAEDLNWSYRSHPVWKFRTLVARRTGELQAFLTYMLLHNRVSVVDIFGRDIPQAGLELLETLIDLCRHQNMSGVEAYCSDASELAPLVRRIGFRRRERAARIVAYTTHDNPAGHAIRSGVCWALNQVDVML